MIITIQGPHNSGKTTLIEQLLEKLQDKKIIVIKNSQLDSIDKKDTDTSRYRQKGAMASILRTKQDTTIILKHKDLSQTIQLAQKLNPDLILIEGYKSITKLNGILLDMKNTFDITEIISHIKKKEGETEINIFAGDKILPLNPFVKDLFYTTIKGMVSSLQNGKKNHIEIIIKN